MSLSRVRIAPPLVLIIVLLLCASVSVASDYRFTGSIGVKSYGYDDYEGESHLWVMQSTRFSMFKTGTPYSLHFSGGYIGDNQDDFSKSGSGRFLKGYLQYGGFATKTSARLGRMFLYRGVALGVFDGLEISRNFGNQVKLTAFGGMMGPLSREFEFKDPSESMAFGGELRFRPKKCMIAKVGSIALSYVNMNRDDLNFRHRYGVATYHRWGTGLTLRNTLHLRANDEPFRKLISRLRYMSKSWYGMVELGMISPDRMDDAWIGEELQASYERIRYNLNYWIVSEKWGAGIDGMNMIGDGSSGTRIGPSVSTPYGEAGYYMNIGNLGKSDGPWVNLHGDIMHGLKLYAYGSMITHEWEEYNLDSEELMMVKAGAAYHPDHFYGLSFSAEYQVYKTPEFDQDRRAIGGINWHFDTAGGH